MIRIMWLPETVVIPQNNEMGVTNWLQTFPGWVNVETYPELLPYCEEREQPEEPV